MPRTAARTPPRADTQERFIDQEEKIRRWRESRDKSLTAFDSVMGRTGGVQNCRLPRQVTGFVEGEHCNVLVTALRNRALRPIASMVDGSVRDRKKPGGRYVYFRVMLEDETPQTMAFGSVGSALALFKARMVFRPRIWTNSRGGYVSDHDGMGQINTTPFSQTKQANALETLVKLGKTARGNAEVGIYGPVSTDDLVSAWCIFPCTLARLKDYMKTHPVIPCPPRNDMEQAGTYYRQIIAHLTGEPADRAAIDAGKHWIEFTR